MWTLLAVALSACAYYVSIGLGEFWPAAWIAPIPVLLVAFRSSWRTAALAAFAAYFLGSLNLFAFFAKIAPVPLLVAELAVIALVFAAAVLVARFAVRRLPGWASAFAFPAAWTSYKFLSSLVSPHSTSLSLAYAQTDVLPLIQIASVTGLWGVTFVVTLAPPRIARLTVRAPRPGASRSPSSCGALTSLECGHRRLCLLFAGGGQWRSLRGFGRWEPVRFQRRNRTADLERGHRKPHRVFASSGGRSGLRRIVR
jgi:apolipoprotein N-acyltransferase